MNSWRNSGGRYGTAMIALHWLGALILLAMLTPVIVAENQPNRARTVAWTKAYAAIRPVAIPSSFGGGEPWHETVDQLRRMMVLDPYAQKRRGGLQPIAQRHRVET